MSNDASPTAVMPADLPFGALVETAEQLAELYRTPTPLVRAKVRAGIDEGSARFISTAPFLVISTTGDDGRNDASPRGGPSGFVKVIDDNYVAIPDLNGNNLIDTIRGVVAGRRAGLIFIVPGKDETLRLNGEAWVTTDDAVLDLWHDELRRPTSAIVVRADEVYIHCAKAFRRSELWDPSTWDRYAEAPDCVGILGTQGLLGDIDPALVRADLDQGYEAGLAHDRPEPAAT